MHPVQSILSTIRNGQLLDELHEKLAVAIENSRKTGKPSEVTLKLAISPAAAGDDVVVGIRFGVTTKLPALDHGVTILFATNDDSLLSRSDPRQMNMFALRAVPQPEPAVPAATRVAVGDNRGAATNEGENE